MGQTTGIKRVLICEDDGITLMSLHKTLTRAGYTIVAEEADGEKAVALAKQLQPDLVLMDIDLAGSLSGLDAASQILQMQRIPILIISAYSDEGHQKAALQVGVSGYLAKPITSEQLLPAIEAALARFHSPGDV